jgi:transcriptional regulator with XRE-family HTH domain
MDRHRLGRLIEAARLEAGLTVQELAVSIQVTASTLRRYEVGRNMPPFDVVVHVAAALGKPLGYFADLETTGEQQAPASTLGGGVSLAKVSQLTEGIEAVARLVGDGRSLQREHTSLLLGMRRDLSTAIQHWESIARQGGGAPRNTSRRSGGLQADRPTHEAATAGPGTSIGAEG